MATIERIEDTKTLSWVRAILSGAGYALAPSEAGVRLENVGSRSGDESVDLDVDIFLVDEVKVLRIRSLLRSSGGVFEAAALAATRGNRGTIVPRFEVEEVTGVAESQFQVSASLCLYADHLSSEELIAMMALFLHEVDSIDNELVSIIEGAR